MTPSQVLTQIRAQVSEESPAFYADTEIYSYMWQAERMLAKKAKNTGTTDSTTSTVASTKEYTIPTGILDISRLLYNSVKLKRIDLTELDAMEGSAYGGVTVTGNPIYYYEFGGSVGLSPTPDAVQTLKFYGLNDPAELSAASSAFTIPADMAQYLIDFCLYRMYLKDGMRTLASDHRDIWEGNLVKVQREWEDRQYDDKYIVVKDEDQFEESELGII